VTPTAPQLTPGAGSLYDQVYNTDNATKTKPDTTSGTSNPLSVVASSSLFTTTGQTFVPAQTGHPSDKAQTIEDKGSDNSTFFNPNLAYTSRIPAFDSSFLRTADKVPIHLEELPSADNSIVSNPAPHYISTSSRRSPILSSDSSLEKSILVEDYKSAIEGDLLLDLPLHGLSVHEDSPHVIAPVPNKPLPIPLIPTQSSTFRLGASSLAGISSGGFNPKDYVRVSIDSGVVSRLDPTDPLETLRSSTAYVDSTLSRRDSDPQFLSPISLHIHQLTFHSTSPLRSPLKIRCFAIPSVV
jgi:hypothetical protein